MRVLAIESSCDETAAAVVESRGDTREQGQAVPGRIVSNIVHTQIEVHEAWGGVVPEIASREHVRVVGKVAERAVNEAGGWEGIEAVVATRGPGLVGTLLVGLQFAKGVALARGLPWLGVHHMEGHLCASMLDEVPPTYPHLALLVSGGHTMTVRCDAFGQYQVIGRTRDDAAGEAFDKVAKIMGLGYPGGVQIDRLAKEGDPSAFDLPRGLPQKKEAGFSFSGLKTHAQRLARDLAAGDDASRADLCASVQEAIVDSLVSKSVRTALREKLPGIVVGGGVAANSRLRSVLTQRAKNAGLWCYVPPKHLCTDNAAMIGAAGLNRVLRGERSPWPDTARSRWSLDELESP